MASEPGHGIIRASATYTVQQACDDWLRDGLDGRSAKTIHDATDALRPILAIIGHKPLRELTAPDVRAALLKSAATSGPTSPTLSHR